MFHVFRSVSFHSWQAMPESVQPQISHTKLFIFKLNFLAGCKGKVKLSLDTHGDIAPLILNLSTGNGNKLHTSIVLTTKKKPQETIEQESRCAPEQVWTIWRREKYLTYAGNRAVTRRTCSP
jgi:hypothetical protein